ncbi:hypothetical protein [Streptomyces sp. NPDC003278]|uniref:hypothetical protein n=1 Tax=Streptomyces sp. NPDC003278 TaxID=3364679 RepID=UPI003684C05A
MTHRPHPAAQAAAATCGRAAVTGEPCPDHPAQRCENCGHAPHGHAEHLDNPAALADCPHCPCATELREMSGEQPRPAVGDRYVKRAAPDAGRIVTVNRVWTADNGHTAVAYEWPDPRASYAGSACPLDVFRRTYRPEAEAEPRLSVIDGRDALAFVIVRPAGDDPERVSVEAGSRGMSKAAAAYALRQIADRFDADALAEGDEPIPYALTEQADADAALVPYHGEHGYPEGEEPETVEQLRARVAELEKRAEQALADHTPHDDSNHCQHDGEPWPCPTVTTLAPEAHQ